MALTATATQRVCDDLKAMLRIEACETFSASVNRPNLMYEVASVTLTLEKQLGSSSGLIHLDAMLTQHFACQAFQHDCM